LTESTQRAVVIGTGSIGRRHLSVLKSLNITALAVSVRASRRDELRSEGWTCLESVEEARDAGATVAIIATDTHRHTTDVEKALHCGLHVLVEKPIASGVVGCDHLPRLASDKGLGLFVACPLRFDPGLQKVRSLLPQVGHIEAALVECRSYLPHWRPERDYKETYSARAGEGGVLLDLIHEIDYALWLFGFPRRISGRLANLGRLGIETDEMADAKWILSNGAEIHFGLDYISREATRSLTVFGETGTIRYDFLGRELRMRKTGKEIERLTFQKVTDDLLIEQMKDFLRFPQGANTELIATGTEGIRALTVCDAWRASAQSGRIYNL
jgi:predicted dehydrogenase